MPGNARHFFGWVFHVKLNLAIVVCGLCAVLRRVVERASVMCGGVAGCCFVVVTALRNLFGERLLL